MQIGGTELSASPTLYCQLFALLVLLLASVSAKPAKARTQQSQQKLEQLVALLAGHAKSVEKRHSHPFCSPKLRTGADMY